MKRSSRYNPASPILRHSSAGCAGLRRTGAHPRARKSLGQNFLMHPATAERIADAAGLSKEDVVLEIGPGTGMLTRPLLARAKKVIAVEADGELVQELQRTFETEIRDGRLELIHGDIRDSMHHISRSGAKQGASGRKEKNMEVRDAKGSGGAGTIVLPKEYKVVANIPYYITGEIMRLLLSAARKPASMTLLVQKEVAERIAPRLRSGQARQKESILSLSVKAYGTPHYEFTVPRGSFVPAPNVDSAALSVRGISESNFKNYAAETDFFALLHAGFAHKRKLLARNLETVAAASVIARGFKSAGIANGARAEDVQLSAWLALASAMHTKQ